MTDSFDVFIIGIAVGFALCGLVIVAYEYWDEFIRYEGRTKARPQCTHRESGEFCPHCKDYAQ